MRRRWVTLFIFLFLSSTVGFAEDAAKTLYDQGKFQEALESILKAGPQTPADYYNAGNCYFRLGRIGQALAYFQKASSLAPGDSDIRYNLNLAERAADRAGSIAHDQTYWTGRIVPIARLVPEVIVDLVLAIITFGLAWATYRAKKRSSRFIKALLQPNFLLMVATWTVVGGLSVLTIMAQQTSLAAVVADLGVGRSGPSETYTELFKVPAGTMVELTGETREGWKQIRFSLGNVGWIMEKDLLNL